MLWIVLSIECIDKIVDFINLSSVDFNLKLWIKCEVTSVISLELVIPSRFMKNSFSDISRMRILQILWGRFFTNRLNKFGKMHFLLIPENDFFHELKCDRMTSFMDIMSGYFNSNLDHVWSLISRIWVCHALIDFVVFVPIETSAAHVVVFDFNF